MKPGGVLMLFCFCLFCLNLAVEAAASPGSKEPVPEVQRFSRPDWLRVRRQECADGTYEHEGLTCCRCAAGQRLKEHCTATSKIVTCELCKPGMTYNSEPNSKEFCDLCTSCDHENANLEEEEGCTPYKDRKCRCKKDHYCISETGVCKVCQPCDTCQSTGVKEPCTATSDTICKEASTGLGGGEIAGIVIAVLVVVAAAVVAVLYFERLRASRSQRPANMDNELNDPLKPVDMDPCLVEIAEKLGWKDMKLIALSSEMSVIVENIENGPNDPEMRTVELLRRWRERTGNCASVELVKTLRKRHRNVKANQIVAILTGIHN